jgi:hypothetical protein
MKAVERRLHRREGRLGRALRHDKSQLPRGLGSTYLMVWRPRNWGATSGSTSAQKCA